MGIPDDKAQADDTSNEITSADTSSSSKLAIPPAIVTARMMEAFPKCDLESTVPAPTFLTKVGLTKDDVRALAALFKRH